MNRTAFRRIGAVVGAAAVVTTITTAPTTAKVEEGNKDRPCFAVRSNWNDAEGPQPTCPDGRFKEAGASDTKISFRPRNAW